MGCNYLTIYNNNNKKEINGEIKKEMSRFGKYDAILLGIFAGFLATYPQAGMWISKTIADIVPDKWLIFDVWSIPVYGMLIGAIIGLIVEKTK